jgi:hypothetical protein
MGGGLLQLVAYGAQDVYLTGNPQITFFKVVYRRHTNFAMESIEQTFNGSATWNRKVTCTISRNGDLIHKMYLRVKIPDVTVPAGTAFRWLDWPGHIFIKTVEVEIGGQRIDKHYSDWLHIWNELTQAPGRQAGYASLVGHGTLTDPLYNDTESAKTKPGAILYIPLEFWFCRNPGLALPLIALQYHEVKINLELADVSSMYWAAAMTEPNSGPLNGRTVWTTNQSVISSIPQIDECSLYVDYVFLDTDERRRFAQVSHEYLIEQLQFTGDESTSGNTNKIKMNFNHPCKGLYWIVQLDDHTTNKCPMGKQFFNYSDSYDMAALERVFASAGYNYSWVTDGLANVAAIPEFTADKPPNANPVLKAKIQLNGHDRMAEMDGVYYNMVQPYQHHSNVPKKGINVYSFALKPEEHQPSGTCNMSRIDNATLQLEFTPLTVRRDGTSRTSKVRIFAINYNVLRVMSGMGGLAYSN